MITATSLLTSLVVSVLLVSILRHRRRNLLPLPPGPKGYPLIGNINDLPHKHAWLTYAEWAKKYGDVMHVSVLGTSTVILNSAEAAFELLEKRSVNYSDRPRMVMANELMGWDWDFVHMSQSDLWRRHRRLFHQYFQQRNIEQQTPLHTRMAIKLLENLLDSPVDFIAHVRLYFAASLIRATYGHEVQSQQDHYVSLVHKAVKPLLHVVHAGAYMVEYIPSLKHIPTWFPGAKFKRDAEVWYKEVRELCDVPFDAVKRAMEEGTAEQSFVSDNLHNLKIQGNADITEENVVKNCAAIAYFAGSDTTAAVLNSFILAMAHFPDVQAKAQAEIDALTYRIRLPNFKDKPSTPYLDATLLETLRWASVVPLAVPHSSTEEDVYKGFRIPAGTTVTPNTWAILHDEKAYPEPFKFKPERFLPVGDGKDVDINPDPIAMGAFGFGRRICPGRHFAMSSTWIAMAYILSTFTISKFVDADGNVVEPALEFTTGVVSHPKPFKVKFGIRNDRTRDFIEDVQSGLDV